MSKSGSYKFECGKEDKTSTTFTSNSNTIPDAPADSPTSVTFTFSASVAAQSSCHLLYSFEGKTVELDKSDVKLTNYLPITTIDKYTYYESKPNIDTKPKPVEDDKIEIIGEVGVIGANLQCRDKKSNKLLGMGVLLGKDENGKNIMKYLFDIPRDSDSFICEVNEIINDLSLIKSEAVDEGDCSNRDSCMIMINGILNLLKSNIFKNEDDERILLEENEYEVSCVDESKNNKVRKYIVEPVLEMSYDDNAIFMISENDVNDILPIGMECRLLVDGNGERVELANSQFGKTLYLTDNGELSTSPCNPAANGLCNKEGDESIIVVNGDLFEDIKDEYETAGRFFIPIKTENRTIIENYLQPGKWISINGYSVQIIKIDYTLVKAPESTVPPRRVLRELQQGVEGYYVILNEDLNSILGSIITSITIKLNDESIKKYEPHISLECSGQGVCNRESGICECFNGYSGDSCQRLDCPNNCNGNGRCVSLSELLSNPEIENGYEGFGNKQTINNVVLDDEVYGCLCDKRHRGYDCSLIECPSTKDPEGGTNDKTKEGEEYRDCSGRGICDYKTGICECFDGFSGEGCQIQIETI